MPDIIIDLRCLQHPDYALRGIGRHARNALGMAREVSALARGARLVGLVDPAMMALDPALAALADEIRPNGYFPNGAGAIFLNPSPLTGDQTFVARLLLDQTVKKAAVVYDFIPHEWPEIYLAQLAASVEYRNALVWLNRYDLFLPVSAHTRQRLGEILALRARRSVVTGAPLGGMPKAGGAGGHVLVVGGDDVRKNPEVVLRAHAMCRVLQGRGVKLVVIGSDPGRCLQKFNQVIVSAGGDPALLVLPGRVSEAALAAFYAGAICAVTPSRAEGFSLPVVEAMQANVPAVVSDIPVHAELVPDANMRFGVDDAAGLAAILERIVTRPAERERILAAQRKIWPAFTAENVARRLWEAVESLRPERKFLRGVRPRIALLAPLPPGQSGVADYSACLAAALQEVARVQMFSMVAGADARPVNGLPHLSAEFDYVVSTMGNSQFHEEIFAALLKFGGACICHDARLLGFYVNRYGADGAARVAAAELGRKVAGAEIQGWVLDEARRETNFLSEIRQAARPLMLHAASSVAALNAIAGPRVRHLPFAIYHPWAAEAVGPAARLAARRRLGFADEIVIASFGFVHPIKGMAAALRALALLHQAGHKCHLFWVGAYHSGVAEFIAQAAALGVADYLHVNDAFVSAARYRDFLLAADFCLQLRIGGPGNISGALQDCIAAGLPGVASEDLAANIDAPGYIARVGDGLDPMEIAAAFGRLFEGLERESFEAERAAYCAAHSMGNYARALVGMLEG